LRTECNRRQYKETDTKEELQSPDVLGIERPRFDGLTMASCLRPSGGWLDTKIEDNLVEENRDAGKRQKQTIWRNGRSLLNDPISNILLRFKSCARTDRSKPPKLLDARS
jgi:hypothetical protein